MRGILLAILVLAAAVRLWAIDFGFPALDTRPDEAVLVLIAASMLYVSVNPRFFHWPSLEFYVVSAIYRAWWQVQHWRGVFQHKYEIGYAILQHPAAFFLVPRVISAAAGVVTVALVYRLTMRVADRATALVAAFLLAVVFLHVRDSHFGVTDVPMTCLLMAAMVPLQRLMADPAVRRDWTRAGLLTGLAASTKYSGGMVGVAALVIAATHWSPAVRRGLVRYVVVAALAFVAGTPFSVLDFREFLEGLRFDQSHLLTGHGIDLGRGWTYHWAFTLRYGVGIPLVLAAIAGIAVLWRRSWREAIVIAAFPVIYYAITGRGYTVFARYLVPLVPFLCIGAAITIAALAQWAARGRQQVASVAMAALALAVAWPSMHRVVAFDRLMGRTDTRVLARAWLEAARQGSEWVAEEPSTRVYPEFPTFGPDPTVNLARFDEGRGAFVTSRNAVVIPEWVVLGDSPLSVYTTRSPALAQVVAREYTLAATFEASTAPEPAANFDQQDMFYVPFNDFSHRIRPGPAIRIFRRTEMRK